MPVRSYSGKTARVGAHSRGGYAVQSYARSTYRKSGYSRGTTGAAIAGSLRRKGLPANRTVSLHVPSMMIPFRKKMKR